MSPPNAAMENFLGRSLAEMDLEIPPVVARTVRASLTGSSPGYLDSAHTRRLQAAVGQWLHESFDWTPPEHAIRPVPDLVSGFRAVLTHFVPAGEPIIVLTPGYMPFLAMPPTLGHPVIEVPMLREANAWRYDIAGIRAAFAAGARMLVVCNPHNPIGKVASDSELAQLETVVAEWDGWVFADEIHAPLTLGNAQHRVYAARSHRAASHTITATSASKAFNMPSLKCGQLVFTNPLHLDRWLEVGHWYEHGTSTLGVSATEAAYLHGRPWLTQTIELLQRQVGDAIAMLDEVSPHAGISLIPPEATYLLWIDVSRSRLHVPNGSSAQTLKDTVGLLVTDGEECGHAGQGYVRFNAALRESHIRPAIQRLIRAAELR